MSSLLDLAGPGALEHLPAGYPLPGVVGAIRVSAWKGPVRVMRLSPVDMACHLPRALSVVAGERHEFQIGFERRLLARVGGQVAGTRARVGDGVQEVEVHFDPVPLKVGRTILDGILSHLAPGSPPRVEPFRGTTEVVRDARRIRRLLRGLLGEQPTGRVFSLGIDGRPVRFAPFAQGDPLPLRWSLDEPLPEPPFQVELQGYNSNFVFRIQSARHEGEWLAAPLPTLVVRRRNRLHRRVAVEGGRVSMHHPVWPDHHVEREILDLSLEGIALSCDPVEDALFPGLSLPRVEVSLPGEPSLLFFGQVRHIARGQGGRPGRCGLWLVPASEPDRRRWIAALSRHLYPGSRMAQGHADELWEIFRDSGYFDLSAQSEAAFAKLRTAFGHFSHKLGRAPEVGYQVIHRRDEIPRGTVSMVKPYAGTWVGYQLARRDAPGAEPDPRRARRILREVILHGYEYAMTDPGFRWFVTWIQTEGRFSRLLMNDLTRRYTFDRDRAAILRFRAFRGRCEESEHRFEPGPEISAATPWEVTELLERLGRSHSRPYLEAHDLVAGRLDLSETIRRWQGGRLQRERMILVARRQGLPQAAAVLELVESGTHLFGLFDLVRLYPMAEGGQRHFTGLLEAARRWYRNRGKQTFAYFCELPDTNHATEIGLEDLGEADLTILSAELMPEQLEHAWEVTFEPGENKTP